MVHVLLGSSTGLSGPDQFWHQDKPQMEGLVEEHDQYGWTLAIGAWNGDGYGDLAVGVPYEDWGSDLPNSGIVDVLYGTPAGLAVPDQVWHQDISGVEGMNEPQDRFGYALAVGDLDGDGHDDLAIGVPYEDVVVDGTGISDAGMVNLLYGTSGGLSAAGDQLWYQGHYIQGVAEAGDRFGYSLTIAAPPRVRVYIPLVTRNYR